MNRQEATRKATELWMEADRLIELILKMDEDNVTAEMWLAVDAIQDEAAGFDRLAQELYNEDWRKRNE